MEEMGMILPGTATQRALTVGNVESLWVQAGGDQSKAPQMAAIAMAESSLIPDNTNVNAPGNVDYGLWQVNGPAHPEYADQIDTTNPDSSPIMDPLTNARDAVAISGNGTNLAPWASSEAAWSTSPIATAGYQGSATTASVATPANTNTKPQTKSADPTGIVGELQHIGSDWTTFWANHPAPILIAAVILLIVAVAFIASDKGTQSAVANVAKTAAVAGA